MATLASAPTLPPRRASAACPAWPLLWGKDGIDVNVICPLAWTAKLEQFQQAYPDAFKASVKMPPMGHYANPETEIGRVCVQLAMPDFKYLSGETLTLEGGMGLRP